MTKDDEPFPDSDIPLYISDSQRISQLERPREKLKRLDAVLIWE